MAYTVKGKRVAFDNIAVGSPTGREGKSIGVTPATTDLTTPYGNRECLYTSPHTVSATAVVLGREKHWKTVSGETVTDFTTDYGH